MLLGEHCIEGLSGELGIEAVPALVDLVASLGRWAVEYKLQSLVASVVLVAA